MEYEAEIHGQNLARTVEVTLVEVAQSLPTPDALPKSGTEPMTDSFASFRLREITGA